MQQSFARHFEREDADNFSVVDGGILGDVHGQCGFAHRWASGKNNKVGLLKAAGHLVEFSVVGGEAGDALAALEKGVDRSERVADDLGNALKAFSDALFGELKDSGFGFVKDFIGGVFLRGRFSNRRVRNVDESAQNGFVADDLDVVFDRRPVGHAVEQAGNVTDVADRLQFLAAFEFFDERDDVDGPGRLGQIHHAGVETAMRVDREVFGLQVLGSVIVGVIVEQNRTEDGALRFDVRRHAADGGL